MFHIFVNVPQRSPGVCTLKSWFLLTELIRNKQFYFYLTWWQVSKRQKSKQMHTKKRLCEKCQTPASGKVDFFLFCFIITILFSQSSWGFKKISSDPQRISSLMGPSGKINYFLCSCCPGTNKGKKVFSNVWSKSCMTNSQINLEVYVWRVSKIVCFCFSSIRCQSRNPCHRIT